MGAIQVEKNEPPFHARWEARVFAMRRALAVSGKLRGNFRSFIESIPPADYLRMSYYEKWFTALVAQITASGLATRAEIESGKAAKGSAKAKPALNAADAATLSFRAVPALYHSDVAPRFQTGQRVRARNINPVSHTPASPLHARPSTGVIERTRSLYKHSRIARLWARITSRNTCTWCASPRGSCGASRHRRRIPSISICGMTTLIQKVTLLGRCCQ